MAININKYVDITTQFPEADPSARAFGGLVFTKSEAVATAETSEYAKDGVAGMTLSQVQAVFGAGSDEYEFAVKYYAYTSPSGRSPAKLMFAKMGETETPKAALMRVSGMSGKGSWGSITFLDYTDLVNVEDLTGESTATVATLPDKLQDLVDVAVYNSAILNNRYLLVINKVVNPDAPSDYETIVNERYVFKDIEGVTYVAGTSRTSGFMPMAILGAIDFTEGKVTNFMFKQVDLEGVTIGAETVVENPAVVSDDGFTLLNEACINFYGRSQTNGVTLDFYQRGYNTNGIDTSYYCNEMWYRSACELAIMNLEIEQERIPANSVGVDMVKLEVIDVASTAVINGTFMAKDVSRKDLKDIREIVNATNGAPEEVDNIEADISSKGYSVYAYLGTEKDMKPSPEKVIVYYTFYGTADSIRFIKGNNVLLV